MPENMKNNPKGKYKKAAAKRKKGYMRRKGRRQLAVVCLLLAIVLGLTAFMIRPRMTMYFLAAAAVPVIVDAILLYRRKGLHNAVYGALMILAVAGGLVGFWFRGYILTNGEMLPVNAREIRLRQEPGGELGALADLEKLDIRDTDISNFDSFKGLTSLKLIDVRGNYNFDGNTRAEFAEALPQCEVLWSVPIDGEYFDSDSMQINLTAHNLNGAQLNSILTQYPEYSFRYAVNMLGQRVEDTATELKLENADAFDAVDLIEGLNVLPKVTTVDLTAKKLDSQVVDRITSSCPNVRFKFAFDIPGMELGSGTSVITVEKGTYEDVCSYEPYFRFMPKLTEIDLRNVQMTEEQVNRLMGDYPNVLIDFSFVMFGKKVSSGDEKVILDGKNVGSVEAVEAYLKYLPRVKQIDMCNCGLEDEQMATLRERHPDIKFVWKIRFGKYTIRTDTQAFSTDLSGSNNYGYTSKTFLPLQYCTDLLFLDLGHNHITNIELIGSFKQLRVLILACNRITDISPLADLEDLEYIELFTNKITDFSPLANKTKLLDLNINLNKPDSIEPFLTCTSLERLWVGNCGLSSSQLAQLKAGLPNCVVNTSSGGNPTTAGWREHYRYPVIEKMYNEYNYYPFPTR